VSVTETITSPARFMTGWDGLQPLVTRSIVNLSGSMLGEFESVRQQVLQRARQRTSVRMI
jgi:hypothetical protein